MSSKPGYIICDSPKIMCPKPERVRRIKHKKDYIKKIPKKLNLDLISLKEIEKDFKEMKNKNEQKELYYLIKKAKNCKNKMNKTENYIRPEKPLVNYFNNFDFLL